MNKMKCRFQICLPNFDQTSYFDATQHDAWNGSQRCFPISSWHPWGAAWRTFHHATQTGGPVTFHLCAPSECQSGPTILFCLHLNDVLENVSACRGPMFSPDGATGTCVGSFATVLIAPVGPEDAPRVPNSDLTQSAIYLICSLVPPPKITCKLEAITRSRLFLFVGSNGSKSDLKLEECVRNHLFGYLTWFYSHFVAGWVDVWNHLWLTVLSPLFCKYKHVPL